jgi:hypothetical protein
MMNQLLALKLLTLIFLQHSWPVPDFISIIPRRLMTTVLDDIERWFIHHQV